MKILITGTAGFIGFHLAERLLKEGHSVIGVDSLNSYYDVNLKIDRLSFSGIDNIKESSQGMRSSKYSNYVFYKCNLEDKKGIYNIIRIEQPSAICNLAAQAGVRYSLENPLAYIQSNVVGFQNIVDACRDFKIKNLSYASSSSVYGGNLRLPFSSTDRVDSPISLYAATKRSNELVAHSYSHLFGIQSTGLRFFTVYGPWGRPDMALFLFVEALRKNEAINVFNNGNMLRDFTYIDDIVEGVKKVIENPAQFPKEKTEENPTAAPHVVYNIGNNNPIKLIDFINEIEKACSKQFKMNMMPLQPGDVPETYADITQLSSDHNYVPKTPISHGIAEFVEWYNSYYKGEL